MSGPHLLQGKRTCLNHKREGFWCRESEQIRFDDPIAIQYPDGRSINWLRRCMVTGRVVSHNKVCDCGRTWAERDNT